LYYSGENILKLSRFYAFILIPTFFSSIGIFGNAQVAHSCSLSDPLSCLNPTPPVYDPSQSDGAKQQRIDAEAKRIVAEEDAEKAVKAAADRAKQDEINAKNERLAEEERAAVEKAKAEEKGERIAATSNERAKLIMETLRVRPDVRNISLQKDTDLKLTGVCYEQKEFSYTQGYRDNANHPSAYTDGYREGRVNAQKGEKYVPRSGGGEFSRGFDDGYYGKQSTGQDRAATVQDSSQDIYNWNKKCAEI
jgi:glucan-binding YG repeat protein